ncbi:MAG: response regulator, partial [Oscillospiraceae bacterium]
MKRSIVIVDDMDINREILAEAFKDKYNIIEAENGVVAMKYIDDKSLDIAAVLLDMVMPEMDGIEVLKKMNESGSIVHIPVFIITANEDEETLMEAYSLGAVDVIVKPYLMAFLKCRIENIIELYSHRNDLEDVVNEQVRKLSKFNKSMIEALATLVEFRDCESGEHIKRMCGLTEILMNKVSNMYPEYRLPKSEIDKIVSASVLHDVGKIAISDSILNKPGKLTAEEFEIMKNHTVKGCEILQKMPYLLDDNVYNYSYDIARHHHERWDGKGYPDHLVGDKISIWSQVVSVVDVYDALVSPRVYKNAFDHDVAVKMIMNGECGVFNPKVLKAFELSLDKIRAKHIELSANERAKKAGIAKLLLVDDSEIDRSILKNILEPDFKTVEVSNGYEALQMLGDGNKEKIDGVLLDISMPILDGFTVLKMLREGGNNIPVVLMTAEATKENVERGIKYNISGFLGKPFNPYTVITKLRSMYKDQSEEDEEEQNAQEVPVEEVEIIDVDESMAYFAQLKNVYVSYLKNANRDDESYVRVSDLLGILLEEYAVTHKKADLNMERINLISKAAYLYDIGRMGIPDEIIHNHKTLDDGLIVYEDHAKFGAFIVRLNKNKGCEFFVDACAEICMHHHERYDGGGYPHKLDGSDITYYTNMTSLCIEFDRMFFKREEYNDRQFDFI